MYSTIRRVLLAVWDLLWTSSVKIRCSNGGRCEFSAPVVLKMLNSDCGRRKGGIAKFFICDVSERNSRRVAWFYWGILEGIPPVLLFLIIGVKQDQWKREFSVCTLEAQEATLFLKHSRPLLSSEPSESSEVFVGTVTSLFHLGLVVPYTKATIVCYLPVQQHVLVLGTLIILWDTLIAAAYNYQCALCRHMYSTPVALFQREKETPVVLHSTNLQCNLLAWNIKTCFSSLIFTCPFLFVRETCGKRPVEVNKKFLCRLSHVPVPGNQVPGMSVHCALPYGFEFAISNALAFSLNELCECVSVGTRSASITIVWRPGSPVLRLRILIRFL